MIRKFSFIIFLLLVSLGVFLFLKSPGQQSTYQSFDGSIFGTRYQVQYRAHEQLGMEAEDIQAEVEKALQRIDQMASTWKTDSEISRYNRAVVKDEFQLSAELNELIERSEQWKSRTGGAFDIHHTGEGIDVSAIAKGYAVDRIIDYLDHKLKIEDCLVEIGGEIKARGHNAKGKQWKVAIYIPPSHSHIMGPRLTLSNTSMATSGQYFKEGHIKNAATGKIPEHDLLSCTVITHSNTDADALATALYVMGCEAGLAWANENEVEVIFIENDGTVIESMGRVNRRD
jgi:thiamine biosynthesis lipoprotein